MTNTPICDFVRQYSESNALRLHMPGHKGSPVLGLEHLDITEIDGADSLYEANGIIAQSEELASRLFGCKTYYSTEGSSQCIRAMLQLLQLHAKQQGRKPLIAAGRNAHKTFLSGAALLDLDVVWLYPDHASSYLSCNLTADELELFLQNTEDIPTAVYLTSPDYLGMVADISAIAEVCHKHNILLAVDNAHGAYLRFLPESMHPIDLGADICCDSAHKTLPVLTGGAYLHISPRISDSLATQARQALALFGSTSPSYLILQSLDAANSYLTTYRQQLAEFLPAVYKLKQRLTGQGYVLYEMEPLKITINAKAYGYLGQELSQLLQKQSIVCEFADRDYLVLMLTPEIQTRGLQKLEIALLSIPPKLPILEQPPAFQPGQRVLTIREAMLSLSESLPVSQCIGRVIAAPTVGCPPAVPILVCGEQIDHHAVSCFSYYGIETCSVVCE